MKKNVAKEPMRVSQNEGRGGKFSIRIDNPTPLVVGLNRAMGRNPAAFKVIGRTAGMSDKRVAEIAMGGKPTEFEERTLLSLMEMK